MPDTLRDLTTLKSYFNTGDKPTQQEFFDWLYTMFTQDAAATSLANTANTNAAAAVALAAANSAKAFAQLKWNGTAWAVVKLTGFSGLVVTSGVAKLTFTSAFTDTKYTPSLHCNWNITTTSPVGTAYLGLTAPLILSTTDIQLPLVFVTPPATNSLLFITIF